VNKKVNCQNMNDETLNKILRKKIIWAEIKAKEQEYKRLCKQIEEIEHAKRDLSFEVQKRLDESQKIADWLLEKEYEALSKEGL
jgi:SMC interacting uncharacterized protein involved in chromosome segregation